MRWLELELPYHRESDVAIVLHYEDPDGPIVLTPGWEGLVSGVPVHINEQGFRDRLFPPQAPNNTVRIMALGDSYTMGDGVSLDHTYPKQLESMIDGIEVMNCGVSATDSVHQREILHRVRDQYHPDLVILGFNVNDLAIPRSTRFDRLKEIGYSYEIDEQGRVTLIEPSLGFLGKAKLWVRHRSHLYRFMARMASGSGSGKASNHVQAWVDEGLERSLNAITGMKSLCDQEGIEFMVFLLPGLLDTGDGIKNMSDYPYGATHSKVLEALKSRAIQCHDLASDFGDVSIRDIIVHRRDRHLNQRGNRLLSELMKPFLLSKLESMLGK